MPPPHTPAAGRLGGAAAGLIAVAAATPLAVAADAEAPPAAFAAAGLLLLTFTAGYAAMARRMPHAGPLYCHIARGLGRPLGIGAAWLALASYQAIQLSLYATLGVAVADWTGLGVTWWLAALGCWAIVALCGLLRISVVAGLLGLLVLASAAVLARDEFTWAALDPRPLADLSRPALGALLVTGVLAFVGFETAAAYAEETRRPRRAIHLPVVLLTLIYLAASIAAGLGLASWLDTFGRATLVAGLLAGVIALQQTSARYLFALGRERVLPAGLGRTGGRERVLPAGPGRTDDRDQVLPAGPGRTDDREQVLPAGLGRGGNREQVLLAGLGRAGSRAPVPWVASLTASMITGAALAGCAAADLDPPTGALRQLGLTGILALVTAAALAALLFLNRNPNGEGAWSRLVAPGLATVGLGAVAYLAFDHLTVPVEWALILPGVTLLGVGHGLVLRWVAPVTYAGLGLGGTAVVVAPTSPAAPPLAEPLVEVPRQREPGAHRPERVNREPSR